MFNKPEFIRPLLCQWTFKLSYMAYLNFHNKIWGGGALINNRSVWLTILEAGKYKIKVSDEGPPAHSLLLMVSRGRRRALWDLFLRALMLLMRALTSQRPHILIPSFWELKSSAPELCVCVLGERYKHSDPSKLLLVLLL